MQMVLTCAAEARAITNSATKLLIVSFLLDQLSTLCRTGALSHPAIIFIHLSKDGHYCYRHKLLFWNCSCIQPFWSFIKLSEIIGMESVEEHRFIKMDVTQEINRSWGRWMGRSLMSCTAYLFCWKPIVRQTVQGLRWVFLCTHLIRDR